MSVRTIPSWLTELTDELEDVIKEKAVDERGIKYEFVDDSQQIQDGLNKIRMAVERLDENQTKRKSSSDAIDKDGENE